MKSHAQAVPRAFQGPLSVREALELCKLKGHEVTPPGLRYLALQHGFLHRGPDGWHYVVDGPWLYQYLCHASVTPPSGWYTIADCAELLQVSRKTIYAWMGRYELHPKTYGAGKGIIHLELDTIRRTLGLN